jgi:hypothetical protein
MARAPIANLIASLTSWFCLKSRRRLTVGGDGGSVRLVLFRLLRKMSEPPPTAVVLVGAKSVGFGFR